MAVDELFVDLAVQIDFEGSIHAHQIVVLCDHVDVVSVRPGVTSLDGLSLMN